MSTSELRVFIASAMAELRDVRDITREALSGRGISAFVYESAAGAQPESVVDTSLRELRSCDIFVGIFGQKFPQVTVQEFEEARTTGKPRFIYIRDKNSARNADLETFLRTEVYDLTKGVSYDYFDSAVKLSRQIGDDVMSWLVRRNRELTAEISANRVSTGELAKLQREIARLQAASREPLPQGTAADQLAGDVRGWFAALGYGIEREILRSDDRFEWLINIPERRGFTRVLVQGVEGEVDLRHFNSVQASLQREKADEAWLVSIRRVSQAVRTAIANQHRREVFAYTLDELLDERASFDRYFDWLEAEVRRRGIDTAYVQLGAVRDEHDPETGKYLGRARYGRENGWLEGYIDRWLTDPSKEHISILGEFGTGKTSFALHYAWTTLQQYREAKKRGLARPRVPLVIPLRDYAKAVTVESLFSEFFFRKYEMLPGYSAFEQLNRMGKLLLIFDGFDEMAAKVDRQEMINNFWRLARVVVPGSKAILTCRTEHFPEAKEGRALLGAQLKASTSNLTGEPPQFEVMELERLDDQQIRELLGFHTTPEVIDTILQRPQLLDLARRPVMAGYILEALPEIQAGKPIDLARIYLYAVTRKMERDIESGRTFTSLADKLYFLCEVAWEMLSTDSMSLNYRQFPDRLANLFGDAVKEQKDLDHWHYDMMGQSLLVRNADGDYAPAHRSLIEFLVAYKFTAELGLLSWDFLDPARNQSNVDHSLEPETYKWSAYFRRVNKTDAPKAPLGEFEREDTALIDRTFGRLPIAGAVSQLMQSMIQDDSAPDLIDLARESGRDQANQASTAANAITMLLRKDRPALRYLDLSGTRLDTARFDGADLTGCDFRGSSLRDTVIRAASLENVQFQGADMTGMVIEEVQDVNAVAVSPDGNRYAAAHDDGTVRIGDMQTGNELLHIHAHDGEVWSIAWSPDGAYIGSVGGDRRLAMWNAFDGDQVFAREAYGDWNTDVVFDPSGTRIITGWRRPPALYAWDRKGEPVGRWDLDAKLVWHVDQSRDGRYLAVSYWDDPSPSKAKPLSEQGIVLLRADRGEFSPVVKVEAVAEAVFFANRDCTFFARGRDGYVVRVSAETQARTVLPIKGIPKCLSKNDELLVVQDVEERKAALLRVWHLPTLAEMAVLRFGPANPSKFADCCACFSPDNSVLIAGSSDGTIRFWDTNLFTLVPEHWTRSAPRKRLAGPGIMVPTGMVLNPDFGKEIRVIEQKVSCRSLRIDDAKGLDTVRISSLRQEEKTSIETTREEVLAWFRDRGAEV